MSASKKLWYNALRSGTWLSLSAGLLTVLPLVAQSPHGGPPSSSTSTKAPLTTPTETPGKTDAPPIVIPFELLRSRHMAVQVKINGSGPYRLVFDTGAPMNLVSSRVAREAGLTKKGERPLMPLFGMGGPKTIDTLEIGDVRLQQVPTIVMDHPTVAAMAKVLGPIEGIIGFPFFARYKTTVDYEKRLLTLVPNGYEPPDVMQNLMQKLMNPPKGQPEPRVMTRPALWGFAVAKEEDDFEPGVTVTAVFADSPAARGGLKVGDRLLTIDSRWTDSVNDTHAAVERIKPGQAVECVVRRGGQTLRLTIRPAAGF